MRAREICASGVRFVVFAGCGKSRHVRGCSFPGSGRKARRRELEHAEVACILSELPAEHPARVAYATGAREVSDSISLTWLVADRRNMVRALVDANMAAWGRTLARQGGYFRP